MSITTRKARLLRAGILAAREGLFSHQVQWGLTRRAALHEGNNLRWREMARLQKETDGAAYIGGMHHLITSFHHELYPKMCPAPTAYK